MSRVKLPGPDLVCQLGQGKTINKVPEVQIYYPTREALYEELCKQAIVGNGHVNAPEPSQLMSLIRDGATIISGKDLTDKPQIEVPAIVDPHIPVGGITLLFGAPGLGKTAFSWALGNKMEEGEDCLGHKTTKGHMLFISLDMNETLCQVRLQKAKKAGFEAKFDFAFSNLPADCLSPGFKDSELYKVVRRQINEKPYSLIAIGALGNLGNFSMTENEMPQRVYSTLNEWLPEQNILLNHHSRKQMFGSKSGTPIEAGREDAFGSQFWTAFAASVIQLHKPGGSLQLSHCKSQVFEQAEPIAVYVDPDSTTLCLRDEERKRKAKHTVETWERLAQAKNPTWVSLSQIDRLKAVIEVSKKHPSTVYRTLNLAGI